jgi:hypothetical protein
MTTERNTQVRSTQVRNSTTPVRSASERNVRDHYVRAVNSALQNGSDDVAEELAATYHDEYSSQRRAA